MKSRQSTEVYQSNLSADDRKKSRHTAAAIIAVLGFCLFSVVGCQQGPAADVTAEQFEKQPEAQTISEGDVLKIEFPGSPSLDSTQQVRRDGRISLSIIGEIAVKGMTPTDLEKELAKKYSTQLVSSEVNVTVVSSTFSIFVTGAVLKPGKIQPDHTISALEAIMEAGGFDNTKANMEGVIVIRQEPGGTKNFTLNLKLVIEGKSTMPFYLKPSDIVYVPEKFSWF